MGKLPSDHTPPPLLTEEEHFKKFGVDWAAPSTFVALGICQLNQWALDFEGNLSRIERSIKMVKELGGFYRCGPELEMCGYSCDDHFHEGDTTEHCWQSLISILRSDLTHNCLVDVGMPVEFKSVRYNCRVFLLNGAIVLIRPKMFLANDGNYREVRWFGAWIAEKGIVEFVLPKAVQRLHQQKSCPFGFAAIQCNDCILASETCEELFVPESPHLAMCLGGVDIFSNGSASYFETGKLKKRLDLIMAPTHKMGGIYLYCNMKGNDGGRLAFDGASFIACNGEIVNMIEPFQINDVEVVVEHINVNRVRSFRASNPSFAVQATSRCPVGIVNANIWLSGAEDNSSIRALRLVPELARSQVLRIPAVPEELGRGAAIWLWDYLRRSGAQGFFLALSGGADSASVAAIVRLLCQMVFKSISLKVQGVLEDLENVLRTPASDPDFPRDDKQLCFRILHTAYLGTRNSSQETRGRARRVANELGAYHLDMNMDEIVDTNVSCVAGLLGRRPQFLNRGSSATNKAEDLALQNIQARCRMATSYFLATLLPSLRVKDPLALPPDDPAGRVSNRAVPPFDALLEEEKRRVSFLLVLSTGNIDETLTGYFTKYDCSSADLNPIGSMSKVNLKLFLAWAGEELQAPSLVEVLTATPSAELRPAEASGEEKQTDEGDMGLTYVELNILGHLRKSERCGPVEMFETLIQLWRTNGSRARSVKGTPSNNPMFVESGASQESKMLDDYFTHAKLDPQVLADKVKRFFRVYCANRHKTTTLTPSYHAETYDPDDARFDWRPCLYPELTRQFQQIDKLVVLSHATVEQQTMPGVTAMKNTILRGVATGSK